MDVTTEVLILVGKERYALGLFTFIKQ